MPQSPPLQADGRFPAAARRCRSPSATSSSARRSRLPSPRGLSAPSSAWAASGVPSASSGRPPASTRPRSATRAATRRTRPTRRPAPAGPATPRPCSSSSIRQDELRGDPAPVLGEPRSDPGHAAGQRRRHAVPLGDLLHDPAQQRASARGPFQQALPTRKAWKRSAALRRDFHDGDRRRPAGKFYYAEPYHQQYLAKNPGGYCGLGGTGRLLPGRARHPVRLTSPALSRPAGVSRR